MTIAFAQQERNLSISIEGVEPFIIAPLPGFAGERATEIFIKIAAHKLAPDRLTEVWQLAVDGVDAEGNTITDGPNWSRIQRELSLTEAESVVTPAFYWQTTLGIKGVEAFVEGGEGLAGAKKALELLIWTLGISPLQTSRSSDLESLILSPGLTPLTTTPSGGKTLDKLPPEKRGFLQNRRDKRRKA